MTFTGLVSSMIHRDPLPTGSCISNISLWWKYQRLVFCFFSFYSETRKLFASDIHECLIVFPNNSDLSTHKTIKKNLLSKVLSFKRFNFYLGLWWTLEWHSNFPCRAMKRKTESHVLSSTPRQLWPTIAPKIKFKKKKRSKVTFKRKMNKWSVIYLLKAVILRVLAGGRDYRSQQHCSSYLPLRHWAVVCLPYRPE